MTLSALKAQMEAACEQLKSFDNVDGTVTADAEAQSEQLFAKFQATSTAAERAMNQVAEARRMRLRGKQTPATVVEKEGSPTVLHRVTGKQKVQSHLTMFFGAPKKNASVMPVSASKATRESAEVTSATSAFSPVKTRSAARASHPYNGAQPLPDL